MIKPAMSRADAAAIRSELAELGRERLSGLVTEADFVTRRDAILHPITQPTFA